MSLAAFFRRVRQDPLALPLYLPEVIFAFSTGLLLPVMPLYALEFEVAYGLVGLLVAGEWIGMVIGDLPAGMLMARLGRRAVMSLGVVMAALATVALVWAGSIEVALSLRVLAGIGIALLNVSRHAYLAETVQLANRGKAIALYGGLNRVGRFIGPAVGGFLAESGGLTRPFLAYAAVCIPVLLCVLAFLPPEARRGEDAAAHTLLPIRDMWAQLPALRRILLTAGIGQVLAQMVRLGRDAVVPLYASEVLGLGAGPIGIIVSASWAIDMLFFYPTGLIMDRFGRKWAICPAFALQGLGIALVPFTGGFISMLLATLVIGLGNGLSSGTIMTLGADLAPAERRSEFLGLWRLIGDMGFAGGPLVVGGLADLLGLIPATFAIASIGLGASLVFLFLVPETLRRPPVPQAAAAD